MPNLHGTNVTNLDLIISHSSSDLTPNLFIVLPSESCFLKTYKEPVQSLRIFLDSNYISGGCLRLVKSASFFRHVGLLV